MSPIRLTDDELTAVMRAAPIAVNLRDEFLQEVANELQRCGEIGPGVVFKICRETQRRFFDPPLDTAERGRRRA